MPFIACVLWIAGASNFHAPQETSEWLTGGPLNRQLLVGVSGSWEETPLRDLLESLAQSQRVMTFIDRRVDPSLLVTFEARQLTWEQLLWAISEPHGLSFCRLEDTYYIGPQQVALTLPEHYRKLGDWVSQNRKEAKVNWRKPVPMHWGRLSQPRQMLEAAADAVGVACQGTDQIAFDIWAESSAANQPLMLKMVLLAVGFNKWIAISKTGTQLKIVDYPDSTTAEFVVAQLDHPRDSASVVQKAFPAVQCRVISRTAIGISGAVTDLSPAIAAALAHQQAIVNEAGANRFTATLRGQRGSVLATVAKQLMVNLDYPPELTALLSQHIEFQVMNATADEIIKRALEGTAIRYEIDNQTLRLFP